MHMFLWSPGIDSAVIAPSGAIRSETFAAGPHTFELTAQIVAGVDAVDPTNDGCQPITTDLTGKIVLLTFSGACGSLATVNTPRRPARSASSWPTARSTIPGGSPAARPPTSRPDDRQDRR